MVRAYHEHRPTPWVRRRAPTSAGQLIVEKHDQFVSRIAKHPRHSGAIPSLYRADRRLRYPDVAPLVPSVHAEAKALATATWLLAEKSGVRLRHVCEDVAVIEAGSHTSLMRVAAAFRDHGIELAISPTMQAFQTREGFVPECIRVSDTIFVSASIVARFGCERARSTSVEPGADFRVAHAIFGGLRWAHPPLLGALDHRFDPGENTLPRELPADGPVPVDMMEPALQVMLKLAQTHLTSLGVPFRTCSNHQAIELLAGAASPFRDRHGDDWIAKTNNQGVRVYWNPYLLWRTAGHANYSPQVRGICCSTEAIEHTAMTPSEVHETIHVERDIQVHSRGRFHRFDMSIEPLSGRPQFDMPTYRSGYFRDEEVTAISDFVEEARGLTEFADQLKETRARGHVLRRELLDWHDRLRLFFSPHLAKHSLETARGLLNAITNDVLHLDARFDDAKLPADAVSLSVASVRTQHRGLKSVSLQLVDRGRGSVTTFKSRDLRLMSTLRTERARAYRRALGIARRRIEQTLKDTDYQLRAYQELGSSLEAIRVAATEPRFDRALAAEACCRVVHQAEALMNHLRELCADAREP